MTTPPAVVIDAQPDLEGWVYSQLASLPGVTSFCYSVVWGWPIWLASYFLQVDARGSTKQQARDRAEQARVIVCGLPQVVWPDGVVSYAQPVDGPFWLPDSDAGPRYAARYEIKAHPNRSG